MIVGAETGYWDAMEWNGEGCDVMGWDGVEWR